MVGARAPGMEQISQLEKNRVFFEGTRARGGGSKGFGSGGVGGRGTGHRDGANFATCVVSRFLKDAL